MRLIAANYNFSRQRALVHSIVKHSHEHLNAEQIYLQAREVIPSIGMATVYRNLNLLSESGLIRKIAQPGEADRFDDITYEHDHAICTECGAIFDVFIDDKNEPLPIRGALPEGFVPSEASVTLYGICKNCAQNHEDKHSKEG